ncbi:MAG: endopeptidase La [candidate division Zixibacteria bacterium]|nr:endopeptidase La [candidate division Zixibacteria bacterium]
MTGPIVWTEGGSNVPTTQQPDIETPEISPSELEQLPLLPTKNNVVFPAMVAPLLISEQKYARLIDQTLMRGRMIGLVTQRDPNEDDPGVDGLYKVGTVGSILKMLRFPDGSVRFLVQGLVRFSVREIVRSEPFMVARIETHEDSTERTTEIEAIVRNALEQLKKAVELSPYISEDVQVTAMNTEEPGKLADLIVSSLNISFEQKQDVLEIFDIKKRLDTVVGLLNKEIEVLELSRKIQSQAANEMGRVQKEYILREQLKAIQKELGESDEHTQDVEEFREKIEQAAMPEIAKEAADKELDRLSKMNPSSAEYTVSRTYLDWLVSVPWNKKTDDNLDVKHAEQVLDEDHYGLEKVKDRIVEYLAVRKLKESVKGPILCFVGPPGVGKTSLGRSIARAMERKFERISLGGMRDEAEIRGHRRTYIGALPGRIIQALRRAEAKNPVLMLDEIDKLGADFRGDPASALLEVLDPEQNHMFSDHYLDVPFDLSSVMFITTANLLYPIPAVLRDRMEVIQMAGYTDLEKVQIAKRYLLPRELDNHGLKRSNMWITDEGLARVVHDYTRESGVRNLTREIATVCRKVARNVATGDNKKMSIKGDNLPKYLGPVRFIPEVVSRAGQVGVVPGLAWTAAGGDILFVEATRMPGRKGLSYTGSLGDVMRESVQAAYSWVRSNHDLIGVEPKLFDTSDVHVHVPAGATPKDGPSAGITMATAIASVYSGRVVAPRVSMTGELTLRGEVMPIGGLKEKALAAYRSGIRTVLIPQHNQKDLIDIPKEVSDKVEFIPVEHMEQVIELALAPEGKKRIPNATKERVAKTTGKKTPRTRKRARASASTRRHK